VDAERAGRGEAPDRAQRQIDAVGLDLLIGCDQADDGPLMDLLAG
jgi:hypothetical protein